MAESELLTKAEVAALFKVTKAAVEKWARRGQVDVVRTPGGARRYRIPDGLITRSVEEDRSNNTA